MSSSRRVRARRDTTVECPICFRTFSLAAIAGHADSCASRMAAKEQHAKRRSKKQADDIRKLGITAGSIPQDLKQYVDEVEKLASKTSFSTYELWPEESESDTKSESKRTRRKISPQKTSRRRKNEDTARAPTDKQSPEPRKPVTSPWSYVEKIRKNFASEPMVLRGFMAILEDCRRGRSHIRDVMTRITRLFEGKKDGKQYINGFNQFLPPGFVEKLAPADSSLDVASADGDQNVPRGDVILQGEAPGRAQERAVNDFKKANQFVGRAQEIMLHEDYKNFLFTLQGITTNARIRSDILSKVERQLKTYPDLSHDFKSLFQQRSKSQIKIIQI